MLLCTRGADAIRQKQEALGAATQEEQGPGARCDESDDVFGDDINEDPNEGIENVDPAKPAPASDATPVPSPHSCGKNGSPQWAFTPPTTKNLPH